MTPVTVNRAIMLAPAFLQEKKGMKKGREMFPARGM